MGWGWADREGKEGQGQHEVADGGLQSRLESGLIGTQKPMEAEGGSWW